MDVVAKHCKVIPCFLGHNHAQSCADDEHVGFGERFIGGYGGQVNTMEEDRNEDVTLVNIRGRSITQQ